MDYELLKNLENPKLYDHPIRYFKWIETHISWILLTGDFAYKIKKPVNFGFLDFSTLDQRKFYCAEEFRLNKTLAPQIYLEVLTIRGSLTHPHFNQEGAVVEYCIKMHEFSQEYLLSYLVTKNQLTLAHMEETAEILAEFHQQTSRATPKDLGTPEAVHAPVQQNFDQIREFLQDPEDQRQMQRLEHWASEQYIHLTPVFAQRNADGFIRECHGDVHLGNITLLHNHPVIFDRIEFNLPFRWTDVMADLGFLMMDLDDHHRSQFSYPVLNVYLEHTGDYQGLQVLNYYKSYRAIVRAKISLFQRAQTKQATEAKALFDRYKQLMALAESYMQPMQPFLLITHGLSGSGKSTLAKTIAMHFHCIHLRSDVERKRLAGLKPTEASNSTLEAGIYTAEFTHKTYAHLCNLSEKILQLHYPVIVDAAFLTRSQRQPFLDLAKNLQIPILILHCHSPEATLMDRIKRRSLQPNASEANLAVLQLQQTIHEPLSAEENKYMLEMDTSQLDLHNLDLTALENLLKKREGVLS